MNATQQQQRTGARGQNRQPQKKDEPPKLYGGWPCDVDAEKSLVASVLVWPSKVDEVLMEIEADDIFREDLRAIFKTVLAMQNANNPVDAITVCERLAAANILDTIGGKLVDEASGGMFVADLIGRELHGAHAIYYSRIVKDKAIRRALIQAGQDAIRLGHDQIQPLDESVGQAESKMTSVLERLAGKATVTIDAVIANLLERLEGKRPPGMLTGFYGFDELTRGLLPGNLAILAARPSMGKTALAVNILENVARMGRPVGIFSLEQSVEELCDRLICGVASLPTAALREPKSMSEAQVDSVMQAIAEIGQLPITYDDKTSSIIAIEAAARIMRRRDKIELLVIDYLQIIQAEDRRAPREQQVSDISRRLKRLAKTLEIPIICLAQLNRQADTAEIPKLSHLRESGAIEQDADIVSFLHRPDYFNPEDRANEADWIIAKHRNGATGTVALTFDKMHMKFRNSAGSHAAAREPFDAPGRSASSFADRYSDPLLS